MNKNYNSTHLKIKITEFIFNNYISEIEEKTYLFFIFIQLQTNK